VSPDTVDSLPSLHLSTSQSPPDELIVLVNKMFGESLPEDPEIARFLLLTRCELFRDTTDWSPETYDIIVSKSRPHLLSTYGEDQRYEVPLAPTDPFHDSMSTRWGTEANESSCCGMVGYRSSPSAR
jgi:hypothetical protein